MPICDVCGAGYPIIPGIDFAGTVLEAGPSSGFEAGEEVVMTGHFAGQRCDGGFAKVYIRSNPTLSMFAQTAVAVMVIVVVVVVSEKKKTLIMTRTTAMIMLLQLLMMRMGPMGMRIRIWIRVRMRVWRRRSARAIVETAGETIGT